MIVRAVVGWQGGAGPPLSGRDTHNPGQSALCARMDRHRGDNVPCESLNSQWTNARVMLSIHRNEFSAEVRFGMDWDLIIGWVGDTRAVGTSWRVEQWGGVGKKFPKLSCCCKRQIFRDNPSFCGSRTLRFRV